MLQEGSFPVLVFFLFFSFILDLKANWTLQALLWELDIFQLLFCKLLERQIMRWEPSYANKATSLLPKNSFSTCAVRWKWRPLVYTEQTGREARGQAAAFCSEPLIFRAKCVFRDKQIVAACNFSGIGVILFLTDKGDWEFERWHSGPRGVGNFKIQVPHRAWRNLEKYFLPLLSLSPAWGKPGPCCVPLGFWESSEGWLHISCRDAAWA